MNESEAIHLGLIDFHLHSYASNVTTYYAANAFSIPESHSDPLKLYELLKRRGMTLLTLTDHNSIDGVKLLLDRGYEDVFISAEMTARFPEDGCQIHVTVANITELQFREIERLRSNVYEMVAYLDQQIAEERNGRRENRIAYFMTHPLMNTENRPYGREGSLTLEHLEKAFLLLDGFEVQNGSRTRALNELTRQALDSLNRLRIEEFANRHDLAPKGDAPWKKFYVAGSDDHSGINPGRAWTQFPHPGPRPTANELIDAMRGRTTEPCGDHGGPVTLAHSLVKLLYDGSQLRRKSRNTSRARVGFSGPLDRLLTLVFDAESQHLLPKLWFAAKALYHHFRRGKVETLGVPFEKVLESEVYKLLGDADFRQALRAPLSDNDKIFLLVSTLTNRIFARYAENLKHSSGNLVAIIKELVTLFASNLVVSLPYLVSFLQQNADSLVSRDVRHAFQLEQHQKLVLFTDTYFEINGVSATIKRMIREAMRRNISFTVVTCLGAADQQTYLREPETRRFIAAGYLKVFTPVAEMDFPEYEDLKIYFPPLLEVLRYLQESGFTKMHISTPGSLGLAGLVAAKTLLLETAATYHTCFPEYVENYTRDVTLEDLAWKYMIAFYHSVDEVLVPSQFVAKLLHKRGLRNRKLLILDRWVDTERFHPSKREPGYWKKYGVRDDGSIMKFTYVGRVGVEKNLSLVADAYRQFVARWPNSHLMIIGDGPFRQTLERQLEGLPVTFTGFLQGEELPRAIASCDVKLFLSTTDTWGNAPLEAQACGLPVIVSDTGGPLELMEDGVTGFKVGGHDVAGLVRAMEVLMDEEVRRRMGRAARLFCEQNQIDQPFTAVFDSSAYRKRVAEAKTAVDGTTAFAPRTRQVFDLAMSPFEPLANQV